MAEINNNNDGSTKLPGTVIGSNGQLSSGKLLGVLLAYNNGLKYLFE